MEEVSNFLMDKVKFKHKYGHIMDKYPYWTCSFCKYVLGISSDGSIELTGCTNTEGRELYNVETSSLNACEREYYWSTILKRYDNKFIVAVPETADFICPFKRLLPECKSISIKLKLSQEDLLTNM